jgi:hypothetical protein
VPQEHWFRLSRALVSIEGRTTLVSWSGSMFEYLMPLLVLRSHPETLLENTYRAVVRAQVLYGRNRHVPWGLSSPPTAWWTSMETTCTRPSSARSGLKRWPRRDLVIAPYATAPRRDGRSGGAAANFDASRARPR